MTFRASFEPKDARIISKEDTDEDIDDDDEKKKRKRTGTQALVEFLNTTSPEEFQKPVHKRSSFFGRRRKSNQSPLKKNYIDLISSPFKKAPAMLPRRDSCYSSSSTTAVRHMQLVSSIVLEDEKSTLQTLEEEEEEEGALGGKNQGDHDTLIEKGLEQRLERYKALNNNQKPSDIVTQSLAHEHVVALENMIKQQPKPSREKKRTRHVQVQTMPFEETKVEKPKEYSLQERYDQMEYELKQERILRQRLQATLEEAMDQFEVLSGMAYKKLREVWEEKVRWENACMQVKERCWQDHQQQILGCDISSTSISSNNNSQVSCHQDDVSLIIEKSVL
ncbi:hypothetical protein G6F57_005745 [Rhizopus arrhizus]|uniref:Uncharacterized protein n=1 Tax=Rhizopus oryzae TaxID=64495 RepID=A0A9P6XCQ2_RHIOR|nr:hypothetical protein G6F24_000886 [Rhizopus arrhizus]KAG1393864.1 hypothetical protein G6F58_012228 [Rhizopus delemar]KAG0773688.1 hypothetical protein G6F22_014665 [Rhizopus arrhizus]KAG0808891.1 hypothetical protein G6F20_009207 [Rhizopus arrhizus]KAG0833800.1 hypothetical protein G6F19_005503 [Rhizopus arrhizus]